MSKNYKKNCYQDCYYWFPLWGRPSYGDPDQQHWSLDFRRFVSIRCRSMRCTVSHSDSFVRCRWPCISWPGCWQRPSLRSTSFSIDSRWIPGKNYERIFQYSLLKGTGSPDGLTYFWYVWIAIGLTSRLVFEFLKCLERLSIEINLFLPVNANTNWLIMLPVPSGFILSVPTYQRRSIF